MKEAFEKIIDRLEEEVKGWLDLVSVDETVAYAEISAYNKAIKIVNQVVEEYDDKYITVPKDDFTEHLINMGYNKGLKDANNDGWIPCSSGELPQNEGMYLTTVYDKATGRCLLKHRKFENGKFVEGGQSRAFPVIAWQHKPLPAPYQPKGEK